MTAATSCKAAASSLCTPALLPNSRRRRLQGTACSTMFREAQSQRTSTELIQKESLHFALHKTRTTHTFRQDGSDRVRHVHSMDMREHWVSRPLPLKKLSSAVAHAHKRLKMTQFWSSQIPEMEFNGRSERMSLVYRNVHGNIWQAHAKNAWTWRNHGTSMTHTRQQ